MATKVIMPKVDMDQATGTVVEWLKQDGDSVRAGEPILVIETDKVAIEVESPATGILRGISAKPGDVVPIATTIAYILEPGEALPPGEMPAPSPAAMPPTPEPPSPGGEVLATPVARNVAAGAGLDLGVVTGTGLRGKVTRSDVEAALAGKPTTPAGDGRVYATPAARRLAREQDVDLRTVAGSGPKGRVQAADVLAAAQAAAALPAPPHPPTPSPTVGEGVSTPLTDIEVIPLKGMRRTIAERMTASYQSVPHITFTVRVDMTRFNEAREQLNAKAEATGGERISATAMIVKAVASTLARHPFLNATLQGEEIHLRREINVGVAVALDEGLIVPVIRGADRKGVAEIAAEVNDLSTRAREGRLVPSDVSGGTFTVSNLGPFGIEQFTAIINPPQSAILAVGATQLEAIPDESGHITARPIMRITLSADHRIVDGAVAARFISDLKAVLETPVLLSW